MPHNHLKSWGVCWVLVLIGSDMLIVFDNVAGSPPSFVEKEE